MRWAVRAVSGELAAGVAGPGDSGPGCEQSSQGERPGNRKKPLAGTNVPSPLGQRARNASAVLAAHVVLLPSTITLGMFNTEVVRIGRAFLAEVASPPPKKPSGKADKTHAWETI
jgi:hypothetical protein